MCPPLADDKPTALVQHPRDANERSQASVNLIFFGAVGLSVGALTLLALPLLGVTKDAVRPHSRRVDGVVAVASGASSQLEVELSVRGRLYGERRGLAATPVPHPAHPLSR